MGALCCKPEPIDFEAPVNLYHFFLLRRCVLSGARRTPAWVEQSASAESLLHQLCAAGPACGSCVPHPMRHADCILSYVADTTPSIGKGAFGKVRVIQHKQTKQLFALKYINKQRCIKQHAVSNILQERRLLEEIDSNFVCNLRYAFQDDENLFMVLDLMLGGDLRFHLDRQGASSAVAMRADRAGHMPEHVVRFYVAELALGLDYLHSRGIVHRCACRSREPAHAWSDLKPDNVLLDEKGHAHLTDFNIAVHFTERRALTSVAGSMAYMGPCALIPARADVRSARGVDEAGLLCDDRLVVAGRGRVRAALRQAALSRQDQLVAHPFDPQGSASNTRRADGDADQHRCARLLARRAFGPGAAQADTTQLLERDITKRLGCRHMGGFEALKGHPWFRSLDWTALAAKQVTPPFEPDVRLPFPSCAH